MRWRKGLRNGDRENGGAWRGGWVEGKGIRDKGQAMESLGTEAREERLEAKERVEYRKEKRRIFIKSCTKRAKSRFFVTNNVKNVTF
mgnify:FL=1|jgi:hypothetical protein